MCFAERYGVDRLGSEDTTEEITEKTLYAYYKELLEAAPVALFYCGSANSEVVSETLRKIFGGLPRTARDSDIGTEVRLNSVEEKPRYYTEQLDVTQGKLAIGFRLGEYGENPDVAALKVFNAAYGGSVTSKLFENVRERLSLCYFAGSVLDTHKGLVCVSSGIEFENYDRAKDEIFAQLDAMKNGDISDDELTAAKKYVASGLRALADSQNALEDYYLAALIDGPDESPEELAELAEGVGADTLVTIARSLECDCVYFLTGQEAAR